jgi:hypothetical protein
MGYFQLRTLSLSVNFIIKGTNLISVKEKPTRHDEGN